MSGRARSVVDRRSRPLARARVAAVHAGRVGDLPFGRGAVSSAIRKRTVLGSAWATPTGLAGDEQGDRRRHGAQTRRSAPSPPSTTPTTSSGWDAASSAPSFGENLTTEGVVEAHVCIGDLLTVGSTLCEVSLPRNPCFRVGALRDERRFPSWMESCGYTGFYLRVRTPGRLFAGAPIQLVLRPHPHLTIAEANRVMHHGAHDRAALQALLVPQLGASWRRTFERRLAGEVEDPTTRRHGPAQDEEHP